LAASDESAGSVSEFKMLSAEELIARGEAQEHYVRSWIEDLRQLFEAGVDYTSRGIEDSALDFVRRKFEYEPPEEKVMALALVEHWIAELSKEQ
jgi:hypothetical protein